MAVAAACTLARRAWFISTVSADCTHGQRRCGGGRAGVNAGGGVHQIDGVEVVVAPDGAVHPAVTGIDVVLGRQHAAFAVSGLKVPSVLRIGKLADSGLVVRRLGELQMMNCASPGYLESHGYIAKS